MHIDEKMSIVVANFPLASFTSLMHAGREQYVACSYNLQTVRNIARFDHKNAPLFSLNSAIMVRTCSQLEACTAARTNTSLEP